MLSRREQYETQQTANLKAKKILAGRDRLIEENGPLVRCIECVAHATRRDTGGPRDAVEGRAVEAARQAGSADRIWSWTAYFLRRGGGVWPRIPPPPLH